MCEHSKTLLFAGFEVPPGGHRWLLESVSQVGNYLNWGSVYTIFYPVICDCEYHLSYACMRLQWFWQVNQPDS